MTSGEKALIFKDDFVLTALWNWTSVLSWKTCFKHISNILLRIGQCAYVWDTTIVAHKHTCPSQQFFI